MKKKERKEERNNSLKQRTILFEQGMIEIVYDISWIMENVSKRDPRIFQASSTFYLLLRINPSCSLLNLTGSFVLEKIQPS